MKQLILLLALALASLPAFAADTYYVRTDGGNLTQCDGKTDAAASPDTHCAWSNPMMALQPSGENNQVGTAHIPAGATLVIKPGSYQIGYGAPGADNCASAYTYDCTMPPVPDGVTINAAGAKLIGIQRTRQVINVTGSKGVTIDGVEITDGEACAEFFGSNGAECKRTGTNDGDWAPVGIYGLNGSDLTIKNANIHGMANRGVMLAGFHNLTISHSKISYNAWAGFDGDLNGTPSNPHSNSGTILFDTVSIVGNGCIQGTNPLQCRAQNNGGYGDGLAAYYSGGDWVLLNMDVRNNTSDGTDLLYLDGTGSLTVNGGVYGGNSGNQLKTNGPATISNIIVHGNCTAQKDTLGFLDGDNCRALGNALSVGLTANSVVKVDSSVFDQGEGDCQIIIGGANSASFSLTNSDITGGIEYHTIDPDKPGSGEPVCGFYADDTSATTSFAGNTWANVKAGTAPANSGTAPPPTDPPPVDPDPPTDPEPPADPNPPPADLPPGWLSTPDDMAEMKKLIDQVRSREKTISKKSAEIQDLQDRIRELLFKANKQ